MSKRVHRDDGLGTDDCAVECAWPQLLRWRELLEDGDTFAAVLVVSSIAGCVVIVAAAIVCNLAGVL